jgi:hypothetical protein
MPTGNTQQVINYGASANDGQGDPLRTAFIKTDDNFDNIWLAGPAGSNIRITNNTIGVLDTNGNLILSPNGVGVIQTNNHVVPRLNRTYDLGTANLTYRTVYANTATLQTLGLAGDLSVGGNLTVSGNIIQVGNIVTETLTIQLANAATTANAANGSGITVGASDNIATLLYNATSNVWTTNIGVSAVGNVSGANIRTTGTVSATGNVAGNYFIGNGSQLTGITSSYGNSNVTTLLSNLGGNVISGTGNITTTANISGGFILGNVAFATGIPATYGNANVVANLAALGSNPVNTTGNITANYFLGNIEGLNGNISGLTATNLDVVNISARDSSGVNIGAGGYNNLVVLPDEVLIQNVPLIVAGNILSTVAGGLNITANTVANGVAQTWNFGTDGSTIFPTLTVTRGDRTGTLTGQTLLFGDSTQEAIISTPDGTNDINDSQRFVINPGKGADGTTGEGGDIYLYAGRGGDAGGSGGDIKIRGGLGPVNGAGGYITMEGGEADVNGVGGYIEIYGGVSGNSNGGYLDLQGGLGQTEGGGIFIQGGQGQAGPGGPVNITGGVSGNGLAEYGNVGIIAGASSWVFDNTGNLTLPQGGVVHETNIPSGGLTGNTIALKPSGGTNADQQLLVYPTAGADFNHLHLTSGNLWNTEMFLGNDDFYVKLANTGNIVINTNDNAGNTAQWTFGTEGTISTSGNLEIQTPSGIPNSTANINSQGGYNIGSYTGLSTTGGSGTGLTVNASTAGNGYIDTVTINTPGSGYTNGDTITIVGGDGLGCTFTIGVAPNSWTLDTAGNLTVAGSIIMPPGASLVSTGASPAPNISGFSSASFGADVTASGNITGGNIRALTNLYVEATNGNLVLGDATATASPGLSSTNSITVTANRAGTPKEWVFTTDGGFAGSGNISGGNLTVGSGTITGGNVNGATFNGNVAFGNGTVGGSGNITGGNISAIGNITGNTAGFAIGYRDIPQVSLSSNATIAINDAGKHYYSVSASNLALTIANNTSVSWAVGTAISIVNRGSGNIIIAQGSGVSLYLAGNSTAANRTISTYGMATLLNVAANTWMINGTGVT